MVTVQGYGMSMVRGGSGFQLSFWPGPNIALRSDPAMPGACSAPEVSSVLLFKHLEASVIGNPIMEAGCHLVCYSNEYYSC